LRDVVVISAVRTPIGNIGGVFKNIPPEELLRAAFEGAIEKSGIEKCEIDEVIAGQAKQSTDQPNIARLTALMVKIPEQVPAFTVHRQCASGMQAIFSGMQEIQCNLAETVLVGGTESMSTAPFYIRNARYGVGSGNAVFVDPNIESQPRSQPVDIYGTFNMIQTADTVAKKFNILREDSDAFALRSQQLAIGAIDNGRFQDEIVPVTIPQRKGDHVTVDTDEYPKRGTSLEKLLKLKSIFLDGCVTAGNASGRNDGASALVMMSSDKAASFSVKPIARVLGCAAAGVDPRIMGIGPVAAINKLLKQQLEPMGLNMENFSIIEINEAFASQTLACIRELGINPEIVNVNGGAIALGHPLGCSGARISTTLLHEMRKQNLRYGMASLCIAGGMGMALAFELL
jgi:acetyl-CoA C-acetyltransferase